MHIKAAVEVLNPKEIDLIVSSAFKILGNTGIVVENAEILKQLEDFGADIHYDNNNARFSLKLLESFLAQSEKTVWSNDIINFTAGVEIFQGYYLDPEDDCFKEWTESRFLDYIKLAKALPNISRIWMLGCPLKETPVHLQPLYEKLYCWKYGIYGGNSIWTTGLCPKIYEMWELYADETRRDIKDVYNGTVYLISPLKFGKVEAEQFLYFSKLGLATTVGTLGSLGGTAPVTLAGALAVHTAENLFINILNRVFFGRKDLHFVSYMSVLDMSSGAFQYGRPEQALFNVACAQIARHLSTGFEGHCGLTDAKIPGHEAGAQKVTSAIFNATACGSGYIAAGLLGVDEVFSPVQMILDDEVTGAVKRVFSGFEVNEETLALNVISDVGASGTFLDTGHTAANFRRSLWLPTVWSREMFTVWKDSGCRNDVQIAKEKFLDIIGGRRDLEPCISEDAEKQAA